MSQTRSITQIFDEKSFSSWVHDRSSFVSVQLNFIENYWTWKKQEHFTLNSIVILLPCRPLQPKKNSIADPFARLQRQPPNKNQMCIMWINENFALYFKSKYWIELFYTENVNKIHTYRPIATNKHLLFISLHSAAIKFGSEFLQPCISARFCLPHPVATVSAGHSDHLGTVRQTLKSTRLALTHLTF